MNIRGKSIYQRKVEGIKDALKHYSSMLKIMEQLQEVDVLELYNGIENWFEEKIEGRDIRIYLKEGFWFDENHTRVIKEYVRSKHPNCRDITIANDLSTLDGYSYMEPPRHKDRREKKPNMSFWFISKYFSSIREFFKALQQKPNPRKQRA